MYVESQYALLSLDMDVEGDLEPYFTDAIERKLLPYVCHESLCYIL
jgi:hypothetical protein